MAIQDPQFDLPQGISGGSDLWDAGLAGVLLTADYFETISVVSYTISPSGSISFIGTIQLALQKNVLITPSGNVVLTGSAPLTLSNGTTSVTIVPSGQITLSGTMVMSLGKVFVSSGTISFSGNVLLLHGHVISPTGNISFSGDTSLIKTKTIVPSGMLFLSGTAPISFNGGGGTGATTKIPLTFAGTT